MKRPPPDQPKALWGPPVDIVREGESLLLAISLPGLQPGDFRIALAGDRQVVIEGSVPYRYPVAREELARVERGFGPFARTIDLPLPVSGQETTVTFRNGLLTVRLPLQLRQLEVKWLRPEDEIHAEPDRNAADRR